MEPSDAVKDPPYLGFYKRMGEIFVPLMGTMLLLIVALQFTRYADAVVRLALASIALGVAVIGVSFYRNRRGLAGMDGKVARFCVVCTTPPPLWPSLVTRSA